MIGTGLDLTGLGPRVHALSSTEAAQKLAAVAEYRTQLPALEAEFALEAHPEILRYEVIWEL